MSREFVRRGNDVRPQGARLPPSDRAGNLRGLREEAESEIAEQHHPGELRYEQAHREQQLEDPKASPLRYTFALLLLLCVLIWGGIGYSVWLFIVN